MERVCISCGMPLVHETDHAMGDETKEYCVHCARPDGTMKSYEEVLDSMSAFVEHTEGLTGEAAKDMARGKLASMPAWKQD